MARVWKAKHITGDFLIDTDGLLVGYFGHDQEIVLPAEIKKIGRGVFSKALGYGNAVKITIPEGVTEIRADAFSCSQITEVILPSTLKKIGKYAFCQCRDLRSITIPDSVRVIEEGAFSESGLEEIHLPAHLRKLGDSVFLRCSSLKKVDFPGADSCVTGCDVFLGCPELLDGSGMLILQNRLYAFDQDYNGGLVQADIPDNVTAVENRVFAGYPWINITMSLNCPTWPVGIDSNNSGSVYTIIEDDSCSLSFRDADGKIAAKVVLAISFEDQSTIDSFLLSIRCRESGGFDFAAYDTMFSKLRWDHNKCKMALARIRYPYELPKEMKETYSSYLRTNGKGGGILAIETGDLETLCILEKERVFTEEDTAKLLEYAQEREKHAFVLELLDYQNRVFKEKKGCRNLDLQDDSETEEE
ncbi:MAG: leucine-rich repeat domain-containing protein [Solobacterium sp.]|nr:leucine-rich repeat domain-containing protein [Solobacterium sp.]